MSEKQVDVDKTADTITAENTSTILDSLDAVVYVCDMQTYKILFINKYGKEIWGDINGRTCWRVLQSGQSGPCTFCTNDRLLDEHGSPVEAYVWEVKNSVNNRWYECRDQAIHWDDGRLVRLEIAIDITQRKQIEDELRIAKQRAESLAQYDVLTGLYNRRAFFEHGHHAFEQSRRFDHPLSVIMMDIDHFKQVNDTYGHSAGDQVLQSVALTLQEMVREIDIVARIGGEEFAFALPETDLASAASLADRLRSKIEGLVVQSDAHQIIISASFGVAERTNMDENIGALLVRADEALYCAKKKGRNLVEQSLP